MRHCDCGNDVLITERPLFVKEGIRVYCGGCWRSTAKWPTEEEAMAAWDRNEVTKPKEETDGR